MAITSPKTWEDLAERIASRVVIQSDTGCWIWTGNHPYISDGGETIPVTRILYAVRMGEVYPDMVLRRSCGTRNCVRPEHMRAYKRLRRLTHYAVGERHSRAKLSEEDVRKIRQLVAEGKTQKSVANAFQVSEWTVSRIVRRLRWTHIL